MSKHSNIQPFWERMPHTFAYGFHGGALAVIIGFALASVLIGYVMAIIHMGLLGLAVQVLCLMAVYKFSYEVLVWTAKGHQEPPDGYALGVPDNVYWHQMVLWFALYGALYWLAQIMPFPVWLVLFLFTVLATPVIIMILAIDKSIVAALNPATWFAVMGRIGFPYLVLVVFLLLMLVSRQYAAVWLGFLPMLLASIVAAIIGNYFMVIMFQMMGYVVYQYHQELGFEPDDPEFDPKRGLKDQKNANLVQAEALLAEGQPEAAREYMQMAINQPNAPLDTHLKYLKLMQSLGDAKAWQEHAPQVVSMMMSAKRFNDALPLVQQLIQQNPKFDLHDEEWMARLVHSAAMAGRPKLSLKLASGFHKRYPGSTHVPEVYLRAAQLLSQRFSQDQKAIALLQLIERDFPDHPRCAEATQERRVLQAL